MASPSGSAQTYMASGIAGCQHLKPIENFNSKLMFVVPYTTLKY